MQLNSSIPTSASNEAEVEKTVEQPVVVSIARAIKPGREIEYETVVAGLSQLASQVPGYQGREIFRPAGGESPGSREYHVLLRFDSSDSLKTWEALPERAALIAQADELTQGKANVERVNGLEAWFSLPERPNTPPPPKWKTVVVTAVGIFLTVTTLSILLAPLVQGWPKPLANAANALFSALLMTFVFMPPLTRLFKSWLYPTPRPQELP